MNNGSDREIMMRSTALAGRVKRYHTWPVLFQETVDHHTMGVLRIYREIFGTPSTEVVEYIMDHDLTEFHTGDLPFPVKSRNPGLKEEIEKVEFNAREEMGLPHHVVWKDSILRRVKICDLLQMWQFGCIEMRMGNLYARPIVDDTAQAVLKMLDKVPDDLVIPWMRKQVL